MTTRKDIHEWLEKAETEHTHMLVVVDTFDHEDYPVFTDDVEKSIKYYSAASMQRIMEVYNLSKDFDEQLDEHRAWNI